MPTLRILITVLTTFLLVYRAHTRRSLTPPAIFSAVLTAIIHSLHPTALPFTLLIVFYFLGTTATKAKAKEKALLTIASTGGHTHSPSTSQVHGGAGGGGRGAIQVLANSGVATVLCFVDLALRKGWVEVWGGELGIIGDVISMGIIANYAATTADTLASELGILSRTKPRLVTNPFRECLPGTNGGVSALGLGVGAAGAGVIGLVSLCWFTPDRDGAGVASSAVSSIAGIAALGTIGSLVDSLLGATLQQTVVDTRTGKVVENPYGGKVLVVPGETTFHMKNKLLPGEVEKEDSTGDARGEVVKRKEGKGNARAGEVKGGSRQVLVGLGLLDNNGVNVAMALVTAGLGMGWWWWAVGDF
ncbi:integral membrane protein DUF92-domain-containing protein [Kalaharituber pfeilii]|nr:integral membrane protein DUF92-domain-containing protein [Kalaharituber pfeilii]